MPEDFFYLWVHRACKTLFGSPVFVKISVEVNSLQSHGEGLVLLRATGEEGVVQEGVVFLCGCYVFLVEDG